ncbi:MAG TPA: NUDIX domain-containing protein [Terriglobales bacterium]|jgi:8-oxo-dGTP pyrophosphatase MutT (NUDIX family)|nr:NUDIX domain-containing protein [Terriglobales bacterium]
MEREISAGGVVVRRMRGRWYLAAIEPQGRKPAKAGKPVLALPKGLVDAGERPEQTALREVREETGVEAEMVAKLGDIKYVYQRTWGDGARVFKIVSFYLLRYSAGRLGAISKEMRVEVESARWLPLEDAPKLLAYGGERTMAKKAVEHISRNPELKANAE